MCREVVEEAVRIRTPNLGVSHQDSLPVDLGCEPWLTEPKSHSYIYYQYPVWKIPIDKDLRRFPHQGFEDFGGLFQQL